MTSRPIHPAELLDLAEELAGAGAGAGRPRTVRLRRAISTAYYGLFHELCWQATVELLRDGASTSARETTVGRWLGHTDVLDLSRAALGSGNAALVGFLRPVPMDVRVVAKAFVDLQQERVGADYDDTYEVTKAGALALCLTARDAVERSQRLIDLQDPTYRLFLRLMIGAVKVAKKR